MMNVHADRLPRRVAQLRKGNILALTALLLPVLFILSAFTINAAYMQLTRTELMVATDAAARAGGRTLSELRDVDQAKNAALATAALNNVAGSPLRLELDDAENEIEFGSAVPPSDDYGRFIFTKKETAAVRSGTATANSIRITGRRKHDSRSGSVDLPLPSFGLPSSWDVELQAVATQVDRDIALILDRSGSMSWKVYHWPAGKNPWQTVVFDAAVAEGLLVVRRGNYAYADGVNAYDFQDWVWEDYYHLGSPPLSPWDELRNAVQSFLTVLDGTDQRELVSIASYASNSTLDLALESDYGVVMNAIDALNPTGNTAIGLGMQTGLPALYEAGLGRPFAAKTLIVMTDGIHNTGIDPVQVARDLVAQYNITIHTITFSAGADQARMKAVARIGGGSHYHASNGAELIEVFEDIANNLPTVVTQ